MSAGATWQEHCPRCPHPLAHHLLLTVRLRPWPMGLVLCGSGDCECHGTWAAGETPGSYEQVETTQRMIYDALAEAGIALPDLKP